MHGSDFRSIQFELGPHPLILFILDWAHSGYIVLAFPGDQWGHSFPANVQAVMPASALAASGGGRFERWHHNARSALMAGGSFELVVTPSSFHYSMNGVQQVSGSQSGNPPDAWSAALCAEVVAEGKQSFTVYDANSSVTIANSIYGGSFMNTTKTNVVLEVIE